MRLDLDVGELDLINLAMIALAFAIGGILKGATGAGAPIIAVPVLSLLYNVQIAVALFVMPNIISNAIQCWQYRAVPVRRWFSYAFTLSGFFGAGVGTILLARFSSEALMRIVALAVFAYVAFRLFKPNWQLAFGLAKILVVPAGVLAGVLQGAAGISAPVSIAFLNAIKLERAHFIAIISSFFLAMGVIQLPLQAWYGLMTWERFLESSFALLPLMLFMPVGEYIGRSVPPSVFDKAILSILIVVAVKLVIAG